MTIRIGLVVVFLVLAWTPGAHAQLDELRKQLPQIPGTSLPGSTSGSLGDAKIGQALKQALQVGTENAVKLTGKQDGYFRNEAIKILLPERVKRLEQPL